MPVPGVHQKRKILLVSAYADFPMRATSSDHLYAFRRYADDEVYYLNLVLKSVPRYVLKIDFDLIVFHTFFLTNHWRGPAHFRKLLNRAEPLKASKAVKAMLPQDEFIQSDLLCEFIREFNIDIVFSVAPPDTWRAIYRGVDFNRVRFCNVLTGYLDEGKLNAIVAPKASLRDRPIDIGYRTLGKPFYWYGRHGFLKQDISDVFQRQAPAMGLVTDISTRQEDAIPGDEWYRFLARCKYTLGVESGTSMIDPDGKIRERTERYVELHPEADMNEVEAACFPGVDGSTRLYALAPRHLECCATRTCQILTEGEYGGILKAGVHYIELKKDFSNIDVVLKDIVDDQRRTEIVEKAFTDVVASGKYTYRSFVRFVIQCSLAGRNPRMTSWSQWIQERIVHRWMYVVEAWERLGMRLLSPLKPLLIKLFRS
jgi:hypothetical protein